MQRLLSLGICISVVGLVMMCLKGLLVLLTAVNPAVWLGMFLAGVVMFVVAFLSYT